MSIKKQTSVIITAVHCLVAVSSASLCLVTPPGQRDRSRCCAPPCRRGRHRHLVVASLRAVPSRSRWRRHPRAETAPHSATPSLSTTAEESMSSPDFSPRTSHFTDVLECRASVTDRSNTCKYLSGFFQDFLATVLARAVRCTDGCDVSINLSGCYFWGVFSRRARHKTNREKVLIAR